MTQHELVGCRPTTVLFIGRVFTMYLPVTDLCASQTERNAPSRLALPVVRKLQGCKAKIGAQNLVSMHCNNKRQRNLTSYMVKGKKDKGFP